MPNPFDIRRYLTDFDTRRVPNILTEVLVIGGGVAGLRAAIAAAEHRDVIVLVKARKGDSNTARAQGGIAAVLGEGDSYESHAEDTLRVGCGLCDPDAVRVLVHEGPARVKELLDWGARLDRSGDALAAGREGGHSVARIVHAGGDATGKELADTLLQVAARNERLRIFENCFAIDLITRDGVCRGAITFHPRHGHQLLWAEGVILAGGGGGQLFRETTNAPAITADGHAMAYRAGAIMTDMEMVQFHPTTLYVAGANRILISEAVRGEGAYLVNRRGHRFMKDVHPQAELAPRDVVCRAIRTEIIREGTTCVYLDARHLDPERFRKRFPQITEVCAEFDIDVTGDLIPVRPSAHYMIGGVKTDLDGRTNIERLWACGESASTGVHGANRLASNSLLEGLVFGLRAACDVGRTLSSSPTSAGTLTLHNRVERSDRTELDIQDVRNSLRSVMWRNVGIERNADRLSETLEIIEFWGRYVMDKVFDDCYGWETQNMLTVARLIARAAVHRTESRGVHYRSDYPKADDLGWKHHVLMQRTEEGVLRVEQ
jgi:L-aspartate oxidase